MKIGIYSPYLDTLTGGEKYIFTAASCLSNDHDVYMLWDDQEIVEKAGKKFDLDLRKVNVDSNIFGRNNSFIKRLFLTFKYDRIIYLSDGSIPLTAARKLIIHFQFPVEWVDTNSFVYLFKKTRISRIICNSYFTKKFIDKKFGVNSEVLYPPARIALKSSHTKKNQILTVGRYSIIAPDNDFKKLSFMVSAFKKFKKKRLKGWKLVIVTNVLPQDENQFSNFEKSIKNKDIIIYKNAPIEQIDQLYNESKIYWHAAGYGENLAVHPERAEHFGISTVEAMSHGAIPVVIKAGGQIEIVKDEESGYLWETEEELIEKTHKAAVDKELSKKLSFNAVIASERFTKERFCQELNHIIW